MPEPQAAAIGGWIKGAGNGSAVACRPLGDFPVTAMNAGHVAYFEDYRRRYFNDRMVAGQGVEDILFCLRDHGGTPRRWIDLGAGVTTLFWAIGVQSPGEIAAADLVPEALHVLDGFKAGDEVPPCYLEALSLVGKTPEALAGLRRRSWTYHVMNCLAPWSTPSDGSGYDLITAIGCFGLASAPETYRTAFGAAAARLAPGGRLVGADWIRSGAFIEMEDHDNRYLSAELSRDCARSCGLRALEAREVKIAGDDYYDSVVVWAFARG